MDDPCAGRATDERNAMRKQRVNGNRRKGIIGKGELFDNADAVDDNIRLNGG